MTPEINRLVKRGMSTPVMEKVIIPYDKIIITSGKHQIRRINRSEDEQLTSQIENSGLENPIVVMPLGDTGFYVPVSGHTRYKSCVAIINSSYTTAKKHGFHEGMVCYAYPEEITDMKEFKAIANVLNNHPKANTGDRVDLVDSILSLYAEGHFKTEDGSLDHEGAREWLEEQDLDFSPHAKGGIVQTVANTLEKEDSLNFTEGTIQTYSNKKNDNGRLFKKFNISDNQSADHYVETENGIVANSIRGVQPSNSLWVTHQLAAFGAYQLELDDRGITADERVLYWHLTGVNVYDPEDSALECLAKTRAEVVATVREKMRALMPAYRPTKIAFIPQFQTAVDADGNSTYGEDIEYHDV